MNLGKQSGDEARTPESDNQTNADTMFHWGKTWQVNKSLVQNKGGTQPQWDKQRRGKTDDGARTRGDDKEKAPLCSLTRGKQNWGAQIGTKTETSACLQGSHRYFPRKTSCMMLQHRYRTFISPKKNSDDYKKKPDMFTDALWAWLPLMLEYIRLDLGISAFPSSNSNQPSINYKKWMTRCDNFSQWTLEVLQKKKKIVGLKGIFHIDHNTKIGDKNDSRMKPDSDSPRSLWLAIEVTSKVFSAYTLSEQLHWNEWAAILDPKGLKPAHKKLMSISIYISRCIGCNAAKCYWYNCTINATKYHLKVQCVILSRKTGI